MVHVPKAEKPGGRSLVIDWRVPFMVGILAGGALFFPDRAWCERPGDWDGFENLVHNPGFEKISPPNEFPDGWTGEPHDAHSIVKMESSGFRSDRSISIRGSGQWSAVIRDITPNAYYLLSFWVKRKGWKDGEYPHIKIFDKEIYQNELFSHGGWLPVSYILNSGRHRETALKFSGKGLTDKIGYDNVSLQEFKIIALSPEEGEVVRNKGVNFVWAAPRDERVYRIRIQFSREGDFENSYMAESFSPLGSELHLHKPLKSGKWFWKVSLWHNGVQLAQTEVSSFAVSNGAFNWVEPPVEYLGSAQRIPADFFPIGIYGAPIEAFGELRQAGFNLVQSYDSRLDYVEKFVGTADLYGLKALASLFRVKRDGKLSSLLNKLKNNAGLYGWYIEDEPEGRGVSPSQLWKLSRFIHDHDPYHPTSLVNIRSGKVADYGPAVDIAMVDPYPVPHMPMTWLSDSIDEARRSVEDGKHVWAVIQAFSWAHRFAEGRFPTYDEGRCLTYLSIVHGAQGILFFSYPSARENDSELKHWAGVKRIAGELREAYSLLLAPNREEKPRLETVYFSERHKNEKGLLAYDANGNPAIHYATKEIESNKAGSENKLIGPGKYLIAVNVIGKSVEAVFSYQSLADGFAEVIFENRTVPVSQNKMKDRFKPYAVHIYKLQ